MSSGIITLFAMLAFLAIVIWVFLVKRKEDFDEQANLPLEEHDRRTQDTDKEKQS